MDGNDEESRSAASVEVKAVEDEFVGSGASRPDFGGWEEEELEAELRVGFDLRGSARDDGGGLDTVAAMGTAAGERRTPSIRKFRGGKERGG